jgi:hypothetical protein
MKTKFRTICTVLFVFFYVGMQAQNTSIINSNNEIVLSKYISSNMVIQREQPFPFRGEGPKGKIITIDFDREGTHFITSGKIDVNGNFNIFIPAMEVTTKACIATLIIEDDLNSEIILTNILIGDVWFAGGQSNMEKKVNHLLEAETVISDADNYTNIRAFRAEYNSIFEPTTKVKPTNASWIVCDTKNVSKASAVAYIFAKKVYQETGIPIGLMQAYVGGTTIETWLSEDKIKTDKNLQFVEDRIPDYDKNDAKFYQRYPSVNYNGMVHPLRFFPIKGFLFYQGESNVKRAPEYGILLKALIQNYREKWNLGDLPFYYVQLFNIGKTDFRNYEVTENDGTWQMLRQQQLLVTENSGLNNIGMAVTIDTNEERLNSADMVRIHPRNKKPVGERLAKMALKEQYHKDIVAFSPAVDSTWVVENNVFIRMTKVGNGLKIRNDETELSGFAVGNKEGIYFDAKATIESPNLISVTSNQVLNPAYIAYGWSRDPFCTLDNSENLPASPFKMDLLQKNEKKIKNTNSSIDTTGTAKIMQTISNPLLMNNGKLVKSKKKWFKKRRSELLDFFTSEVYGQAPEIPTNMVFKITDIDSLALNGKATRKQISVLFEGTAAGQKMSILMYTPNAIKKQVPLFLALNFHGNQAIADDKNIEITTDWVNNKTAGVLDNKATEKSRGIASEKWPLEIILKNGYGVATIYAGDIAPDNKEGYKTGIQTLFPELANRPDNLSTMGAWAWGLSRAMDYLETDKNIDTKKVIVLGTSRLGKAALWAGATDPRFAMVISNESGAGGAKLYHHAYKEDIAQICRVFPHWFSTNFQNYKNQDANLPFDQHLMMALIAPRPLLIASAKEAYVCDPYGEFLGALAVSPVYQFLGKDPLPLKTFPKENEPAFGTLGYYMRSGKHDIILYDWQQFIDFANLHLKK